MPPPALSKRERTPLLSECVIRGRNGQLLITHALLGHYHADESCTKQRRRQRLFSVEVCGSPPRHYRKYNTMASVVAA